MAFVLAVPAVAAAGAAYWWSGSGTKDGSTAKDEQPADPPQEEDERYLVFEGAAEVDEAQAPAPEDEARYDRVQRLVRDAVAIYRARGYGGTITVSQKVGIFTEACTLRVEPPASAPWTSPCDGTAAATTAANPESRDAKAGRVFQTLFARLERRAQAWQKLSGVEGLDRLLQASIT